ncbi:chitin synthase activator [Colletotrichum sojae]|uniref:Chitin synthase activator n=1 Tax=Colletotrichum sojae TaxID=2175907 RepID=A0A8H6JPK1_9PEZI|nr:chitin synthase activator [Colletotrichum sojae]
MDFSGEVPTRAQKRTTSSESIFIFHDSSDDGCLENEEPEGLLLHFGGSLECDLGDTSNEPEDDITELVLDATALSIGDYSVIIEDMVDRRPETTPNLTGLLATYRDWKMTQRSADEKSVTLQYLWKISQGLHCYSPRKATKSKFRSISEQILFLEQTVVDFMLGGHVPDIERFNQQVTFEVASTTEYARKPQERLLLDASGFPVPKGLGIPPSYEQQQKDLLASCATVLDPDPKVRLEWAWSALSCVRILSRDKARISKALNLQPTQEPEATHRLRELGLKIIEKDGRMQQRDTVFYKARLYEISQLDQDDPSNPSESKRPVTDLTSRYLRAAKLGSGRAHYRLGMSYDRSDTSLASENYTKGVKLEDSGCMNRRAMISLSRNPSQQESIDLLRRSAENADIDAPEGALNYGLLLADELFNQHDSGTCIPPNVLFPFHAKEKGNLRDPESARKFIAKAAMLGSAKAQVRLGRAYELSQLGCPFDPVLSLHYYRLAATQGCTRAALGVSKWFGAGNVSTFDKNEKLEFEYLLRAATGPNGLAEAQFALGQHYERVVDASVERNKTQAQEWYMIAASNGNEAASTKLAESGRNVAIGIDFGSTSSATRSTKQNESSVFLGYLDTRASIVKLKRKGILGGQATIPEDFVGNSKAGQHIPTSLSRIWRHALGEIRSAADSPGFFSVQNVTLSVPTHWNKSARANLGNIAKSVGVCDTRGSDVAIIDDAALAMFSLSFDDSEGLEGGALIDRNFERYVWRYGYLSSMSQHAASEELSHMRENDWIRRVKADFDGGQYEDDIKVYSVLSKPPLPIDRDDVRQMFAGTLGNIKIVLDEEVKRLDAMGLKPKGLYLVGGLAACRYIREKLEDYLPALPLSGEFQVVQMAHP